MSRKTLPSKEEILFAFRYDRKTGEFFWKRQTSKYFNKARIGTLAGTIDSDGYVKIVLSRKPYFAHRLVWLLEYGEQPEFIDHVDGNKSNNRISNLRAVSQRQNQSNRPEHRSGHLIGTTKIRDGKWRAQIETRRKNVRFHRHLGYFETQQEAHAAYMAAAETLV